MKKYIIKTTKANSQQQ